MAPSVVLRRAGLVLVVSLLAAGAVRLANPGVLQLQPGEHAWERAVGGATPSGRVLERARVRLPGLRRAEPGQILIQFTDERTEARVGVDGGALRDVRANRDGVLIVSLPRRAMPSATLELVATSEPLRVRAMTVTAPASPWPPVLALVLMALTTGALLDRAELKIVFAIGIAVAAMVALPFATTRFWLPLSFMVVSALICRRSRFYWAASGLAASVIFGLWVRVYFLPSAGSWDTEYWKAWMTRAVSHGTTHVYGGPDAVREGAFFDQLWGRSELWRTSYRGREFVVDYPPGAMAIWRWSWFLVRAVAPGLESGEAENVAVKLPPILGDVASVALLLWIFRRERRRAVTLAALYWAMPVSWLSSSVLGFLDGAYAPLAVGALVAASAGRAGWAGVLLAVAALIKPQALIVVPAAAVALVHTGASLRRAMVSGLTVVGVALIPFIVSGALDEAVTHVFRILFQQRLSAGYANPWWLVGSLLSDEPFAPKNLVPFAGVVAVSAFTVAASFVCFRTKDAAMMGGGLIFAYAMLALGVHHNHPHVMFLAFAATGIHRRHFGWIVGILSASYVLNMLCLSGIGRFYGSRYLAMESIAASAAGLRTALGFDLTLLLALVNTVLFGAFLVYVRRHE